MKFVALLGGLFFVVLALVATSFPIANWVRVGSGRVDIRGNWRPDTTQACSDGKFLAVADDQIGFIGQTAEQTPIKFDVVIVEVPQAAGPVLVLHPWSQPYSILMLLHTDVSGGELRFVATEWSEPAIAAFGNLLNEPDVSGFLGSLQRWQPYHRCP